MVILLQSRTIWMIMCPYVTWSLEIRLVAEPFYNSIVIGINLHIRYQILKRAEPYIAAISCELIFREKLAGQLSANSWCNKRPQSRIAIPWKMNHIPGGVSPGRKNRFPYHLINECDSSRSSDWVCQIISYRLTPPAVHHCLCHLSSSTLLIPSCMFVSRVPMSMLNQPWIDKY